MIFSRKLQQKWIRFWMYFAGTHKFRRMIASLSTWMMPPFYSRVQLSQLNRKGYISPQAILSHHKLLIGDHVYIDDGVLIFQDHHGETVEIQEGVHLHRDTIIQTGSGGSLTIGNQTHVQPKCQFSAYKGKIVIGCRAEIAPSCAFYSYDHGTAPGVPVRDQAIVTKGGIILEDDVWLGYGVIILDGVRIGRGAVIGAGSVVTKSIPAEAIAAGNPARIIRMR